MRFFLLVSACVLIVACKARAPLEPQPTRTDSVATISSNGESAQSGWEKGVNAQAPATASPSSAPASTVDLTRERTLIDEAEAARTASDYDTTRAKAGEAVASLLARSEAEQDAAWLSLLDSAGRSAYHAQDMRTANTAWQRVFEVRSRTLPDDHPDLQAVRQNLAVTIGALGDLQGERALEEKVFEVQSRTLSDDRPELQLARQNLANTIKDLGDLEGARALFEKVLEVNSRTLPEDHPDLQAARLNLARTIREFGDLQGERALEEKALEVFSRTLPDDDPDLQKARLNLAGTIHALGDLQGARELLNKVLEVDSRTLPDDHPDLQLARENLAGTIRELGDFQGARALFEKVLEVNSRTLPDDHPELQRARVNVAIAIADLGDFQGAQVLFQKVIEVDSRTLPDDHPELQKTRSCLAVATKALGDLASARALEEKVLDIQSRTLPDDDPELQSARENLAITLAELGTLAPATSVDGEQQRSRAEQPGRTRFGELLLSHAKALRRSAVSTISDASSREAEERVSSLSNRLGLMLSFAEGLGVFDQDVAWEPAVFLASESMRSVALASARVARGASSDSEYEALRARVRVASDGLASIARAGATADEYARAREELESAQRDLVRRATWISGDPSSFFEPSLASLASRLMEGDALLAFRCYSRTTIAHVDPPIETAHQSLCAFVVRRASTGNPTRVGDSETGDPIGLRATDIELTRIELGPIQPIEAAVERWRESLGTSPGRGVPASSKPVGNDTAAGESLRALVLDPLREHLIGIERVIVALDDVLNAVSLDALPAGEKWNVGMKAGASQSFDASGSLPIGESTSAGSSHALVGDCLHIETRSSLLELLIKEEALSGEPALVVLGGADFGARPSTILPVADGASVGVVGRVEASAGFAKTGSNGDEPPAAISLRSSAESGVLRGSAWEQGFVPLPATLSEARALRQRFADTWGARSDAVLLDGASASRENLFTLAPKARFLHLATHGWFAPESVKSTDDPTPIDKLSGLGARTTGEERVKGMSPMLLCGLALAGANLPASATGRIPGLVTAEELSTLDLTNCELAVLSACDTNVGERRAGQGVASLQKALDMAGARSVITSLWKVPDEATKDLMLDFYRRLWVEKKPKWQALWEAKMKIRNEKDEAGRPKYTTRDWAAWVLTGDPN